MIPVVVAVDVDQYQPSTVKSDVPSCQSACAGSDKPDGVVNSPHVGGFGVKGEPLAPATEVALIWENFRSRAKS